MRVLFIFVFALIIFIMISGVVQAGVSLGTVQVDRWKEVYPGERVAFKVLLFNLHGDGDIQIEFEAEHPPGWVVGFPGIVNIKRTDIIKNPESETGYEFIRTNEGYIKAKPVVIEVLVPVSEVPGSYETKVTARTLGGDGMLSVSQSRGFVFISKVMEVSQEVIPVQESQGSAEVITSQPVFEDDIFLIDEERESENDNGTDTEKPENNTKPVEEVNEIVDSITGAVTAHPVPYSVFVLVFSLLMFAFLKVKKKI